MKERQLYHIKWQNVMVLLAVINVAAICGLLWVGIQGMKIPSHCEYYVNVVEWTGNHPLYVSTGNIYPSCGMAEVMFNQAVQEEQAICLTGSCLDSSQVLLIKSCNDSDTVTIVRDTLIIF